MPPKPKKIPILIPRLYPELVFQMAWAQDRDELGVCKVMRGAPFSIVGLLELKQTYFNQVTIFPISVNFDFVHLDLGKNKISHAYQHQDYSSLGQYPVSTSYEDFTGWSVCSSQEASGDGDGGWHQFKIIADINDVNLYGTMITSKSVYVKLQAVIE